jgi:nitrogen fixation NifU-like protein
MAIDPVYSREIIMDNYTYPRNKSLSDSPDFCSKHMASDSCIDDITVQASFKDGKIEEVRFDGQACTVSTASTSILTVLVEGKTMEEAQKIINEYFKMIDGQPYDPEVLQEAAAFEGVSKQPNRIGCATIGWRALQELMDSQGDKNGREE